MGIRDDDMEKSLKVLDLRYQKLAELYDNSDMRARDISCTTKVNEVPELTFKIPANNPKVKYLLNEYLLDYDNEYYVVKVPQLERSDDGTCYYSYTCNHLSSTLQSNTLTLGEVTPANVISLMQLALAYEDGVPTLGWSVGTVEVDTTIVRGMDLSEQSSFAILCTIADMFDGMLRFRSKARKVDLLKLDTSLEPKAFLTVRKNLKGLKVSYDSSEMVTRLYCFGAEDAAGNEIDIMSVNPTGKAYIEDYSYYTDLGYTQDDFDTYPELFVKTNIWRDTNYVDSSDLYTDGLKQLERVCKPKIEVSISALDTSIIDEYQPALTLNIGDVVIVDDYDLGVKFRCYVTEKTYNDDEPYILNLTISNEIDYRNVLSELFASAKTVAQVVTNGAVIQGSHINGISTDQVRNLEVEYCSIEHLVANYIDANSIAANYATITALETIVLKADDLEAEQANIKSLLAGNAGIGSLSAIHLTADNVVIDDAVIKELIAGKITVSDLAAGNIDTREIHIISSDDGSGINIADQTMQFVDENGDVRIQIGEDSNGDFSFILTGPNGTQLLTEEGLKADAIADDFIKNKMIDDNAVDSRTIDWTTAGATEDENGNPIWDTASLTMNGEMFEVKFTSLQELVNNNIESTTALGSELTVLQQQITNKVWSSDIETAIDEFNETEISTIREKQTSIDQTVNSITSQVSEINTTLDDFGGRIDSAESSIEQNAEKISANVTSIDSLGTRMTTVEQTASGLTVRIGEVEDEAIVSTIEEFYLSSSATKLADGSWSETQPTWENGKYLWRRTLVVHGDNTSEYIPSEDGVCITGNTGATGKDGQKGEDSVLLYIDSSNGTVFKNNGISTILSVTIYYGSKRITDIDTLKEEFGNSSYLQWKWKLPGNEDFIPVSAGDYRIGASGFTFTVSADDIVSRATIICEMIA